MQMLSTTRKYAVFSKEVWWASGFVQLALRSKTFSREFVHAYVIDICPNFRYMDTSSKFIWLFTNEHEQVLKKLGSFIEECFLLRGHN